MQFDKVLYEWFTTMRSEVKPVTGPAIIEKATYLCDEMKIRDKYTFSDGSKKITCKNLGQHK